MTPEEFISIANQAENWLLRILSIVFTLAIFFYVRSRAGSSLFIHERAWRILGGRKNFYKKEFQDEWQRLCDLEKFNYSTGIRFSTHERATKLLPWLKDKGIHLEELIRIKKYFNSETFNLRQPKLLHLKFSALATLVLFILGTFSFAYSGNGALLKINKTGTYIWVSNETARALTPFHWIISKNDCKDTPPSEHDKKVSCSALSDEKSKKFLTETIRSQQLITFLLILLPTSTFLASAMRSLSIGKEAAELYTKVNKTVENSAASTTDSNG